MDLLALLPPLHFVYLILVVAKKSTFQYKKILGIYCFVSKKLDKICLNLFVTNKLLCYATKTIWKFPFNQFLTLIHCKSCDTKRHRAEFK